jgi:hypothetical protein
VRDDVLDIALGAEGVQHVPARARRRACDVLDGVPASAQRVRRPALLQLQPAAAQRGRNAAEEPDPHSALGVAGMALVLRACWNASA